MKRPLCAVCLLLAAVIAARVFLSMPEYAGIKDVPAVLRDGMVRGERVRILGQVQQCRVYENQVVLWLQKIAVSGEESGTVRLGESSKEIGICYCEESQVPPVGSTVSVEGVPDVFSGARNPGEFDSARYYWTQGVTFRLKNARLLSVSKSRTPYRAALFRVQQYACGLLFAYMPEREAGVLCAMLLGDKTSLDGEVRSLYSQSGIAHVLAISGLHISMLGALLYRTLRRMGAPLRGSMAVCCAFLLSYSMMTGMSASTLRASLMFVIGINAERVRRTYDLKTALAVSMAFQLFRNPRLIVTSAFQLSFGAVAGVAWAAPALEKLCADCLSWKKSRLPKVVRAVLSCLAVSLTTMPILLAHQYEYAVYGVLFNLLILPSVSVLLPAGFLLLFSAMAADGCAACARFLAAAGVSTEGAVGGLLHAAAEAVFGFAWFLGNVLARAAGGCCKLLLFLYERGSRIVGGLPGNLLRGRPQNIRLAVYAAMLIGFIVWVELCGRNACAGKKREAGGGACDRGKGEAKGNTCDRGKEEAGGNVQDRKRTKGAQVRRDGKMFGSMQAACSGRETENRRARKRALLGMGWIMLAFFVLLVPVRQGLRVTMLDVGQGDGICIEQNPGHAILVDCGSSDQRKLFENRLLPFLKYRGIHELDAVFLSHLDTDHVSAVYDLLKEAGTEHIKVRRLVIGQQIPRDEAYEKLLAAAETAQVPLYMMRVGEVYADGACRLTCLGPSGETGKSGDRNACSLVLRLDYGDFQALFLGDADARAELAAMQTMGELAAMQTRAELVAAQTMRGVAEAHTAAVSVPQDTIELLKAAHHGSRYSTSEEFLRLVRPRIAILSAGADNSYGHPHEETLARLNEYGCDRYLTAESGAVTVYVNREGMRVETFLEK